MACVREKEDHDDDHIHRTQMIMMLVLMSEGHTYTV